jgi:UTP--glucose-1-phosphate uridylyltransferase
MGPGSVLACKRVQSPAEYDRYGFAAGEVVKDHILRVSKIIEKPGKDKAPSDLASVSGYLLMPEIFKYIEAALPGIKPGQELMLQPALQAMIDDNLSVFATEIQNGSYHDTGDKLEYLKTVVEFALKHDELNEDFRTYLKTIVP